MTVALIALVAVVAICAWQTHLDNRYGNVVSPDQTIPVGIALIGGWLLIIAAAITAIGLVVA